MLLSGHPSPHTTKVGRAVTCWEATGGNTFVGRHGLSSPAPSAKGQLLSFLSAYGISVISMGLESGMHLPRLPLH